MTTTITDAVSTLNLQGYPGNDFVITFRVLGTDPMPVVAMKVLSGQGGTELDEAMQPDLSTAGRDIIVTFSDTDQLPESSYYQLLFGDRIVLVGLLRFSYSVKAKPVDAQHTILIQSGEQAGIVMLYPSGLRIPQIASLADLPTTLTELSLFSMPNDPNIYGVRGQKRYVILMDELPDLP